MKKYTTILTAWLPLAVAITALCFLIYVAVQQEYRQSANDPQIQIAEDIAQSLTAGQQPQVPPNTARVDIAKSLAPYMIIYDETGKLITSLAQIDGKNPKIPQGVFQHAKQYGQNRFTWEPKQGVRSAVVLAHYQGSQPGYILVGRSLREVEKREDNLYKSVLLTWLGTLLVSFLAVYIKSFIPAKK